MASFIYDTFFTDLVNGAFTVNGAVYKCMLVGDAYVPDQLHHLRRSDITGEVTGATGYTAGGQVVTGTWALNSALPSLTGTFSSPSWSSASITARGAVIYHARGGAATADELVAYVDFGMDVTSVNSTFNSIFSSPLTFTWSAGP